MPSTITLRRKIRSIGNTKQITRAMQMVAASKMRRAQEAVTGTRAYAEKGAEIMRGLQLALKGEEQISHPLLTVRPVSRIALVVIASDRGLAGGYNANITKKALQFLEAHKDKQVSVIAIGRKAQDALVRAGVPLAASFTNFPDRPVSADILPIARLTIEAFLANEYDQVTVVYTKFYSTLRQVAEEKQILPVKLEIEKVDEEQPEGAATYIFEPAPAKVLEYILPRMVEMQLLQTLLESIASEHSSRMIAMKNATDNATELLGDLRLTYNSIRQANITQEIAEISAGANAA